MEGFTSVLTTEETSITPSCNIVLARANNSFTSATRELSQKAERHKAKDKPKDKKQRQRRRQRKKSIPHENIALITPR